MGGGAFVPRQGWWKTLVRWKEEACYQSLLGAGTSFDDRSRKQARGWGQEGEEGMGDASQGWVFCSPLEFLHQVEQQPHMRVGPEEGTGVGGGCSVAPGKPRWFLREDIIQIILRSSPSQMIQTFPRKTPNWPRM